MNVTVFSLWLNMHARKQWNGCRYMYNISLQLDVMCELQLTNNRFSNRNKFLKSLWSNFFLIWFKKFYLREFHYYRSNFWRNTRYTAFYIDIASFMRGIDGNSSNSRNHKVSPIQTASHPSPLMVKMVVFDGNIKILCRQFLYRICIIQNRYRYSC